MSILKTLGLGKLTGKPSKSKSAAEILAMEEKRQREMAKRKAAKVAAKKKGKMNGV